MKKVLNRICRIWSLSAVAMGVFCAVIGLNAAVCAQTRIIADGGDAVLTHYKIVLNDPEVQEQSVLEMLSQVKGQKPIALIHGYWAFVYDYDNILHNKVVQKAIQEDFQKSALLDPAGSFIVPEYTGPTQGVLFIPHNTDILKDLGLDILADMFPGLGVGADLGGIMGNGCWGDDPWDRDPWPEDEEPWPPEEDDDDEDPWDRDPWPEDEQPWPPKDDLQLAEGFFMFTREMNEALAQEVEFLFNMVDDATLSGDFTAQLGSEKNAIQITLQLP